MGSENRGLRERFLAHGTSVGTDIVVRFFMTNHVRYVRERFTAGSTHIRLLFAMRSFVNQEIVGLIKLLIAFFAGKSANFQVIPLDVFLYLKIITVNVELKRK